MVTVRNGMRKKNGRKPKATQFVLSRMGRRRGPPISRLRRELKFFDTAVSFGVDATLEVPATGQWALIPQGDTSSTRDGRQALIKSFQFRGILTGPVTAANATMPVVYMWVVLDRQANGAAAAATDVFVGSAAGTALINLNNNRRFSILHKQKIAPNQVGLIGPTVAVANTVTWPIEFFKKISLPMTWNSTAGAITEITQNNIFIIAGLSSGTGAVASDDDWNITGNARLRFYSD